MLLWYHIVPRYLILIFCTLIISYQLCSNIYRVLNKQGASVSDYFFPHSTIHSSMDQSRFYSRRLHPAEGRTIFNVVITTFFLSESYTALRLFITIKFCFRVLPSLWFIMKCCNVADNSNILEINYFQFLLLIKNYKKKLIRKCEAIMQCNNNHMMNMCR